MRMPEASEEQVPSDPREPALAMAPPSARRPPKAGREFTAEHRRAHAGHGPGFAPHPRHEPASYTARRARTPPPRA